MKKKIHHFLSLLNRATSNHQCDTCVTQFETKNAKNKKVFFAGHRDRDRDRMTDRKKQQQEVYLDQLKQLVPGVNNHTASKVNSDTFHFSLQKTVMVNLSGS